MKEALWLSSGSEQVLPAATALLKTAMVVVAVHVMYSKAVVG